MGQGMSEAQRVAFLGLGRMGVPMASRLRERGHHLTVWNRTRAAADSLATQGVHVADSPADAARGAQVVITMLADPGAVEGVLMGDEGILRGARHGATFIDCSTVGPEDSRACASSAAAAGLHFVDAPVLGSIRQAEAGELTILAGGDEGTIAAVEPTLLAFGTRVVRAGPVGNGSALKLVMNLLVGGLTELLAEAFTLADRAGVPKDVVRETLFASVLNSPFVGYKAPQLLDRQFSPLFTTRLLLKDLNLALHLATDLGIALPATVTIRDVYARSADAGRADQDFSAVIEQVATEPPPRQP